MKKRRAQKDGLVSNSQLIEIKRRAKLICDALENGDDEKVETIAIESIKFMGPGELVVLAGALENFGYYDVGEAIATSDIGFFEASEDDQVD
jgi:hypothetical protein